MCSKGGEQNFQLKEQKDIFFPFQQPLTELRRGSSSQKGWISEKFLRVAVFFKEK